MADEMQTMRREYWEHVRTSAEEIERDVRAGDLDPDDAHDRLHEECDSSQWAIFTYRAQCVVCFLSDHPDALVDEFGADGLVQDGNVNWSGMAYCALLADICGRLGDLEEIAAEGREEREEAEAGAKTDESA